MKKSFKDEKEQVFHEILAKDSEKAVISHLVLDCLMLRFEKFIALCAAFRVMLMILNV